MKRDMEKVRNILVDFSNGKGNTNLTKSQEDLEYIYHLEIMRQAGLITYKEQKHKSGMFLHGVPRLTWIGNDYLEAISNEGVWAKTKDVIKNKGMELSNVPIDLVVDLAKYQIKNLFGLE